MIMQYNVYCGKMSKHVFPITTGRLTTLSSHDQRLDSDNSQSVTNNDYHDGKLPITSDMYNLSNGEA